MSSKLDTDQWCAQQESNLQNLDSKSNTYANSVMSAYGLGSRIWTYNFYSPSVVVYQIDVYPDLLAES